MSTSLAALDRVSILYHLSDKNQRAQEVIKRYAARHSAMDIAVGAAGLTPIPGAATAAIVTSIALQTKVIYQPMAAELADIYTSSIDSYTEKLGFVAAAVGAGAEFAQEFALEFLVEHAQELLLEAGLGLVASAIPFVGAVAGATIDYLIAQKLTWRVGTMTSIYFQNGSQWVTSRQKTMEYAKAITGGINATFREIRTGAAKQQTTRVDLNDIPNRVPEVKDSAVRNILPLLKGFADKLPRPVVRDSLIAMGLSAVFVDAALHAYYG